MHKLMLLLLVIFIIPSCTSTKTIDTVHCIKVENSVENNENQSGDDLYKECIDKQHQKNDAKKGFWEKSLEELLFLVIDVSTY